MTDNKPHLPWPGADEQAVVEEMIRNPGSEHWEKCSEFVKQCVYLKARNIPNNFHEEIIQEIMYKVTKNLPHFHFHCALKSWLNPIIKHCIIDMYRRLRNVEQSTAALGGPSDEGDHEDEIFFMSATKSAEEVSMIIEDLHNAVAALLEYASIHANSVRNKHIIRMVIFEGRSHVETAKAVGCEAPVVSYVIREAQRYVREKMGHK